MNGNSGLPIGLIPPYARSIADLSAGAELLETSELHDVYRGIDAEGAPPQFDVILLKVRNRDVESWAAEARRLRLKLQRNGALFLIADLSGARPTDTIAALEVHGLRYFRGWTCSPDGAIGDLTPDVADEGAGMLVLRFQRAAYDPIAHARAHLRTLALSNALAVLAEVPDHWYAADEERGLHEAERLVCLLAQDRVAGPEHRLVHFVTALHAYNRACTLAPLHAPAYQCMASFWRAIGREDMATRLMRTVHTIKPSEDIQAPPVPPPYPPIVPFTYPAFDATRPPRLLLLCHPESDFGADVLHDGLRRILGPEQVAEYPWKPTLHGESPELAYGYPCTFEWPEKPASLPDLVRRAAAGYFDAILYADVHGTLPRDDIRQILAAAGDTPLFLVDMWDECGNLREIIQQRDALQNVAGYFKREMVRGVDYGPNAWPVTFAYPDDRFAEAPGPESRSGLFWAGKLIGGARRLQLSWLRAQLPINGAWGEQVSQDDYVAMLRSQSVGLSFFGNGFDTVRYWELPAHGVMLLSERTPLVTPHDFEDGRHAVFFDDAEALLEKARYFLEHPGEAAAIAAAGHRHAREFHTGSARARQCLGLIQERLRELGAAPAR